MLTDNRTHLWQCCLYLQGGNSGAGPGEVQSCSLQLISKAAGGLSFVPQPLAQMARSPVTPSDSGHSAGPATSVSSPGWRLSEFLGVLANEVQCEGRREGRQVFCRPPDTPWVSTSRISGGSDQTGCHDNSLGNGATDRGRLGHHLPPSKHQPQY